jgi:(2S)-methylsuccinyl-CoA dehydrogenase
MIIQEFKKFVEEHVTPYAHEWHLKDELIPMDVINKMSELRNFWTNYTRRIWWTWNE